MGIRCSLCAVPDGKAKQLEHDYQTGAGLAVLAGEPSCYVDKSWHAMHFILTGSAEEAVLPEGYLLEGGTELQEPDPDELDVPVRLLSPDDVKAFHAAVQPIDETELRRRFDPDAMADADIYSFDVEHPEDEFEILLGYFAELQTFLADAVKQQRAVVITLG
jgi:hypothetical protein